MLEFGYGKQLMSSLLNLDYVLAFLGSLLSLLMGTCVLSYS